jgi:hypothetical protein
MHVNNSSVRRGTPEKEAILHIEGAENELPPYKDEELPSMSEGEEIEEESPPTLEGVLMFSAS